MRRNAPKKEAKVPKEKVVREKVREKEKTRAKVKANQRLR